MTVTANSTLTGAFGATSTTVVKSIPSVPAGATLVLGILDRSDETTTISGISDDVNGAWTLNYVAGPVDSTNQTYRCWQAYRNNCAAGTTNVTVTFNTAINSQLAVAYITSDQGEMTFDAAATVYHSAGAETNVDSLTATATGAGAIVGFLCTNNSQTDPEPTADGAGESRITSGQAGARAFLFFETYTGSGSYGIETTGDSSIAMLMVGAFKESAASSSIAPLASRNFRAPGALFGPSGLGRK